MRIHAAEVSELFAVYATHDRRDVSVRRARPRNSVFELLHDVSRV